jgi:hypothetical protein
MRQLQAESYVLREWQKLPLEQRQTGDQAAAFAMKCANEIDFPCKGDKYQVLMACLNRWLSQTQGKV